MMTLLLRIYKKEGIMGWYQGFTATMINTFSMRKFWFQYLDLLTTRTSEYAYFFFYSLVRSSYIKRITRRLPAGSKPPTLSTLAELVLGAVAGALAQVFTIPVSVIATRQQLGRAEELGDTDNSFMSVAREIIEEDGVTGLWLGLNPGLVLTVNPAITYGLFERIKSMVLQTKGMSSTKMGPWLSFVVGALSKTLATVVSEIYYPQFPFIDLPQVTYPYIMAKVRIQARTTDSEETEKRSDTHQNHHKGRKHPGALKVLIAVWKHEGFFGWYQVCASIRTIPFVK